MLSPLFGRRPQRRERTAAEREAARLERERRRALREGRPWPPPHRQGGQAAATSPAHEQPVEPPPAPEPEPAPPAPEPPRPAEPEPDPFAWVEPATNAPEPVTPEPPVQEPAPEPFAGPAGAPEPQAPAPGAHEPVVSEPPAEPVEPEPVVPVTPAPGSERPAGVRRLDPPKVGDLPRVAPPRSGRSKAPRHAAPRRRARRRPARPIALVLLLVVLAAVVWLLVSLFQPFHGQGGAQVRVTIPAGATAGEIGEILAEHDVVSSATFFSLRARLSGKRDQLKAGTFTLRRGMSYGAAIEAIAGDPLPPDVIRVTLPEGRSIGEAASLVRQAGVKGSYRRAAQRNPRAFPSLRRYGVPSGVKTLEGFLFPATYELKKGATARELVEQQLRAFRRTFDGKGSARSCPGQDLTPYQVLIVASMVEREAELPRERRLIAGVICNRLRQGIPLGIDATIRYRLNNWTRPLRQSELQLDSPFNTRLRQGLPPTPIGSPGKASIEAALRPARNSYLYYVVKPCGNGAHAFSSTEEQFQRDVAAYHRKRNELGGKDPSTCPR